jgi:hypothetical protein
MQGLTDLWEQGRMTWVDEERGWSAAPEDVVKAFSNDGFEECKRATTTSRRDLQPAGGLWQGVNRHTGSVASAIWVIRPPQPRAIVFIAIDGQSLSDRPVDRLHDDSHREDGGES